MGGMGSGRRGGRNLTTDYRKLDVRRLHKAGVLTKLGHSVVKLGDGPELLAKLRPHALLMFGLAARTAHLRIETRARNAVTMLWPDAAQTRARKGSIGLGPDARPFGPHTAKMLHVARATGIDARASRDAGAYLCNYLSWRAIEAAATDDHLRLAAFIHIPLLARGKKLRRGSSRITLEELVDAGEAMLMEIVKQARRR